MIHARNTPSEGHCPRCQSDTLRRVKTSSWLARIRKALSEKRPLICETCQWRGWLFPVTIPDYSLEPSPSPNLGAIDRALDHEEPPRKVFPDGV